MKKIILLLFLIPIVTNGNEHTFTIRGASMSPCLSHGQKIKMHPVKSQPLRNDLIAFKYKKQMLLKRVVALKGDHVKLKKNNLCYNILVNNIILKNSQKKPYCITRSVLKNYPIVDKDEFIVLGDLITGSNDSSLFGPIHYQSIRYRLKLKTCFY